MRVVTGEAKGRKLKAPKTLGTRPILDRVKTALFDILSTRVEDARFLDLFAGTGSVGIEALSRGAASATFIEMNYKVLKVVRENLQITGLADRAEVIRGDAFKFLQTQAVMSSQSSTKREYDIIYVAPPQYQEMAAHALALLDKSPLVPDTGLVIVQIHPKERAGVAAVPLTRLALTDERRYGSTLLMFYEVQGRDTLINNPGPIGGRFAFLDAGEAARRLQVDRVTLDQLVRDGRLKAYKGVGRDSFFRASDVEALYKELHPSTELAEAVAADERESSNVIGQITVRKKQDPQMRVYQRLLADAKWYDTSEEDIRIWFQQLAPEGYERNKKNAEHTIQKLQFLVSLIEEAQKRG